MKTANAHSENYPQYRETPKAVLAAVAFSLAMRICQDDAGNAKELLRWEWDALHDNGIVPQKRPSRKNVGCSD